MVAYVLRRAVLPLRRVVAAHARIAAGSRTSRCPREGRARSGTLATAFNEMSRSLSATQSSLAAQNDDLERLANVLRAVLDSTVDGILLSDADGEVQLANRPVIVLDPRPRHELRGPRRRPAALRRRPHGRPRRVPRRDGAAAREPRRADLRRVRGRRVRTRLPGLHRTGARRSRRLPRPDLDAARGDRAARARPAQGRFRRDRLARAPDAADVDDGLPRDDPRGRSGRAERRAAAVPRDRLPQLRTAAAPGRRSALRRAARRERPAAAVRGRRRDRGRARRGRIDGGARPQPVDRPARGARRRPAVLRRPGAPLAARRQPDLERAQVHARGRNGRRRGRSSTATAR